MTESGFFHPAEDCMGKGKKANGIFQSLETVSSRFPIPPMVGPVVGKVFFGAVLLMALSAWGNGYSTYYVDAANGNDANDGGSWATAKQTIQNAVDNIDNIPGHMVLVTNGVYDMGGAVASGYSQTNRVCIDKAITVQSVNGPDVTIIVGAVGSNGSNDTDSVRGVYLGNGAALSGFTVTNGYTKADYGSDGSGGGIYINENCSVSNCVVSGCHAFDNGGGVYNYYASLTDSRIIGNTALENNGGGVYFYGAGTLERCLMDGNTGYEGGGLLVYGDDDSTVSDCVIQNNSAQSSGGGVFLYMEDYENILLNCVVSGNRAQDGGGIYAYDDDGGDCYIRNCAIYGNNASSEAGAVSGDGLTVLYNCTVILNEAPTYAGVYDAELYNCIVYDNTTPGGVDNFDDSDFSYCCTYPMPNEGTGNIADNPQMADMMHIAAGSPCLGAGDASYTDGTDIDGDAWLDPPAIGCDQPNADRKSVV